MSLFQPLDEKNKVSNNQQGKISTNTYGLIKLIAVHETGNINIEMGAEASPSC